MVFVLASRQVNSISLLESLEILNRELAYLQYWTSQAFAYSIRQTAIAGDTILQGQERLGFLEGPAGEHFFSYLTGYLQIK